MYRLMRVFNCVVKPEEKALLLVAYRQFQLKTEELRKEYARCVNLDGVENKSVLQTMHIRCISGENDLHHSPQSITLFSLFFRFHFE